MTLTVRILTPERQLPELQADHVTLPASDGEVGIRPMHAAMVCELGEGLLRVLHRNHPDAVYAVRGGVAEVGGDVVRVLAESAVDVHDISETALVEKLKALDARTYDDPLDLAQAKAEAGWMIAQLRAAGKIIPQLNQVG